MALTAVSLQSGQASTGRKSSRKWKTGVLKRGILHRQDVKELLQVVKKLTKENRRKLLVIAMEIDRAMNSTDAAILVSATNTVE